MHDNPQGSLNALVDQVAEWPDDADRTIAWTYAQCRSKPGQWLVSIEVRPTLSEFSCKPDSFDACNAQGGNLTALDISALESSYDPAAFNNVDQREPKLTDDVSCRKKSQSARMNRAAHSPILAHLKSAQKVQLNERHHPRSSAGRRD